jgi:phosphoribosylanthranilate isomerase
MPILKKKKAVQESLQTGIWLLRLKKRGRVILAGGLNEENIAEAVAKVRPFAVDVASGVERSPGIKDSWKMRTFFKNAAEA